MQRLLKNSTFEKKKINQKILRVSPFQENYISLSFKQYWLPILVLWYLTVRFVGAYKIKLFVEESIFLTECRLVIALSQGTCSYIMPFGTEESWGFGKALLNAPIPHKEAKIYSSRMKKLETTQQGMVGEGREQKKRTKGTTMCYHFFCL